MKPEKLIICGWGPYKEETVIDFTKFNTALFLITGQTGAGKTTIFDAIAYALFGLLSGEVRDKGSVRSDFADENTRTYVELYMTHKKERYHILRNPEYLRPKKKKGGESSFTKEKENAVLTLPDGTIIAGNQDVTRKIEELLGMDGKQFRQISMIAQGEFAKMLLAGSNEKTAIFRELFGTGIYAAIQSSLKERSAKIYREFINYKNKMEEDVRLLTLEDEGWNGLISHEQIDFEAVEGYLSEELSKIKDILNAKSTEEKTAEEEALGLKEELEKIRQINSRFKELNETKGKLDKLEEKQEEMKLLSSQIQMVQTARLLALEEKVVIEKEQAADEVQKRLIRLRSEYQQCVEETEALAEVFSKKAPIQEAYLLKEQIDGIREQICTKQQEWKTITQLLDKARNEYVKAQETADKKRDVFEAADRMYKSAVIGIAARFVEEGKPCPVCGSLSHPNVAQISHEVPDEKQLEALKQDMEAAQKFSVKSYETAVQYQNEEKHLNAALKELEEKQQDLCKKQQEQPKDIQDYVMEVEKSAFEAKIAKYLENQLVADEKQKQIETVEVECERKQTEGHAARTGFEQSVLQNGFETVETYRQAVSCVSRLSEMEQEYRSYQDNLSSTKNLYEHLQDALKGLKPVDEESVSGLFLEKQGMVQSLRKEIQTYHIQADQIKRSLSGIRENRKKAEAVRKEYGIVKDLDDLANGNNARRLVFEQYVLAGYFEQVLKAANLRLIKMTDGRYELIRAKQVSDGRRKDNLEILVMDYYTGKERSVKTLSGGETFKASLALALGMSDCIQVENGGLEVETLFIDEGFGALDEESLEQSCAVLQSLAGNNRMIGIISHVPELRERIENQIVIEKKNFGSSVRVQV